MSDQFSQFHDIFNKHKTFVITTHVNPDGDAIGSETAPARFLTDRGKKVKVINQSETPDHLKFLEEIFPVNSYEKQFDKTIVDADCICVVDTNSPKRFSALAEAVAHCKGYKVCIDHHLEHEPFADLYIIDTDTPATCELLYRILHSIDPFSLTKPIANALYAGIMTDTASFRFPKTDSETHTITADLIARGVDPYDIYQKVFETGPLNKLWLLGKALESIQLFADGSIAAMLLPRSVFAETKTTEADVDNFTSYVLSIKGVKVGLVFVEQSDGTKVSFRSKGNIPVNILAKQFNGGGHKNAAGARLKNTSLPDALKTVLASTEKFIQQ